MSSGVCRAFNKSDCVDDFMIGYRNRAMAEKAWHCNKHHFCDKQHAGAFKDGFIQGYAEVASGGNGCVPAVAPSEYWGWRYQSAQGQGAVNAWFEGFPMGVQAAEEAGVGHWQTVRPSGLVPPAAGSGAMTPGFPSSESEVTNPFYSEPKATRTSEGDDSEGADKAQEQDEPEDEDMELKDGEGQDPESVFHTPNDYPVISDFNGSSDLVESHEAAVAAKMGDEPGEVSGVVVDDVFGSASGSVSDSEPVSTDTEELPFSFE
jgi:hypothetical protein